ncbi:hypothetical protein B0T21DRAFT_182993 [Apiosordaria backusii]|uniref:Infection structure specific protein n=1 Tax=Apiosordaria backusii TaxID=314023 RepID=A0AA40BLY5_9PEZI|nr:hypothetical protein B0T21DRAFT_182993 [Apiosordaria backusii]
MKPTSVLMLLPLAVASPDFLHAQSRQEPSVTASATPIGTASPCEQSYYSIIHAIPTQPPIIINYITASLSSERATISSLKDIRSQCSWVQSWSQTFVGDTPAVRTAVSVWNSQLSSWISEAKDEVSDFARSCATAFGDNGQRVGNALGFVATDVDDCVTAQSVRSGLLNAASLTTADVTTTTTSTSTATPTEDPGQDDDGGDGGQDTATTTSTSTSTAGAARETGYMMAAAAVGVAVAGVMGSL